MSRHLPGRYSTTYHRLFLCGTALIKAEIPSLPEWTMAEGSGFRINPAMGIELRAGHVHRDRQGRSPAPSQSHHPAGRKRVQQATAKGTTRKVEAPELPRLRALEAQAASIPISSSAASSTSPRSGSSRVHPYPAGEAAEGSSFELVPSVATQAAQSWDQGEMEITPIRDANMSPVTPPKLGFA